MSVEPLESNLQHSSVDQLLASFPANNLRDGFQWIVDLYPNVIALETEFDDYSYAEINQLANCLAHALLNLGASVGGVAAFYLADPFSQLIAMIAFFKCGLTIVTNDTRSPDAYNAKILQQTEPSFILIDADNLSKVNDWCDGQASVLTWEAVDFSINTANPSHDLPQDWVGQIVFTSGSTGEPKGVLMSQREQFVDSLIYLNNIRLGVGMKQLHIAPLVHVNGMSILMFSFLAGATVSHYNIQQRGLGGLKDWIAEKKITHYLSVPTVFRFLFQDFRALPDISSIQNIHLGGETVRPSDVETYKKAFAPTCRLMCNLGCTEGGTLTRKFINKSTVIGDSVPLGKPYPHKHILICDDEGCELADGECGEIVVESEFMAFGYLNDPKTTAEKFLPIEGKPHLKRYKTGDLGCIDSHGDLLFFGRKDGQIKINGHRVELGQIESVLLSLDSVEAVAVRSWDLPEGGVRLDAYVVPVSGMQLSSNDLYENVEARLPGYMRPRAIHLIDALPLTQSMKVDVNALPHPDDLLSGRSITLPKNELECSIYSVWQKVFEGCEISCEDSFASLGGDSMSAANMNALLEEQFSRALPMSVYYEDPTILQMARLLSDQCPESRFITIQSGSVEAAPLILIHGVQGQLFHQLAFWKALSIENPIYALIGENGSKDASELPDRLEDLAKTYAEIIIQHVPHGSFYLAGYSLGGLFAYEIARCLKTLEHPCLGILMIDTIPRNLPPHMQRVASVFRWRNDLLRRIRRKIRRFRSLVVGETNDDPFVPKREDTPDILEETNASDPYVAMGAEYRPDPQDIQITLVKAVRTVTAIDYIWRKLSKNQLTVYRLDCRHSQVFLPRYQKGLAHAVREFLK